MQPAPLNLRLPHVCARRGTTPREVLRMIAASELRAYRLPGGRLVFAEADVQAAEAKLVAAGT